MIVIVVAFAYYVRRRKLKQALMCVKDAKIDDRVGCPKWGARTIKRANNHMETWNGLNAK